MSAATATAGGDACATTEIHRWARREGRPVPLGKEFRPAPEAGYVATWDVDLARERFERGAFSRTAELNVAAGKVMLLVRHLRDGADVLETVGQVVEVKEDEKGLWIRAKFSAAQSAQDARTKVIEGLITGLSIGYRPIKWDYEQVDGKKVLVYREAELLEATLTNRPTNPAAAVISAKNTQPDASASGDTGTSEPGGTAPAPASTPPAPPVATVVKRDLEARRRRLRMLIRE
jgi:HK97 family phage prohead protease